MHNFITANEIMMSGWLVVSTLMMSTSPNQYDKTLATFDRETVLQNPFEFLNTSDTHKHIFQLVGFAPYRFINSTFCIL